MEKITWKGSWETIQAFKFGRLIWVQNLVSLILYDTSETSNLSCLISLIAFVNITLRHYLHLLRRIIRTILHLKNLIDLQYKDIIAILIILINQLLSDIYTHTGFQKISNFCNLKLFSYSHKLSFINPKMNKIFSIYLFKFLMNILMNGKSTGDQIFYFEKWW
jgi:hypothetical protein